LTEGNSIRAYILTPLATELGGVGFRLGKADNRDGHSEEYDCLIDLEHGFHQCDCLGFLRHSHCKHTESLLALVKAGKLASPQPAPKPEAQA
jgi:hypothetical protein